MEEDITKGAVFTTDSGEATALSAVSGIVQPVIPAGTIPEWLQAPMAFDIFATIIIGILTVYARELRKDTGGVSTKEATTWILEGATFGLAGGELASLLINDNWSWLLSIAIAWVGANAMDKLMNMIISKVAKTEGTPEAKTE